MREERKIMLTSKQRAALRAIATGLDTILRIGKGGVTETVLRQADAALTARELIKLSVLENAPVSIREAADEIAERVRADVVQVIGSKAVLYRRNPKEPKIEI